MREFVDANEDLNTLLPKSDAEFLLKYLVVAQKLEKMLREDDKSLYRPVAHQDIPFYVPKDIQHELLLLGAVGGGPTPTEIECQPSGERGNLMRLYWQLPPNCGDVLHYQVEYEYVPNKQTIGWRGSGVLDTSYHDTEPHYIEIPGNVLNSYISNLCPGYAYRFRIRSSNAAGLGMWSNPVTGCSQDFPFNLGYTKKIHCIRIPHNGCYRITAEGAKGKDGQRCSGGRGAIISATFSLKAGDVLIILCGGMSELQYCNTGGGGGTFVAVNEITKENLLIAAGGGGGTRGFDDRDEDGCDASLDPSGTDGRGHEHGKGGVDGGPGEDANSSTFIGPCWGYGGAGFLQNSSSARSFSNGGDGGQYGGFGGGGAVGVYGGGGGGGYSGGGGGRGGGGGGSYVRDDGIDVEKKIGNEGHGSVTIEKVSPPYPIDERDNGVAVGMGGSTRDIPSTRAFSTASPPNTSIVPVDSISTLPQFSHPTQITSQSSRSSQSSQLSENGSSSRLWSLSSTTAQLTTSTVSCDLGPVTEVHRGPRLAERGGHLARRRPPPNPGAARGHRAGQRGLPVRAARPGGAGGQHRASPEQRPHTPRRPCPHGTRDPVQRGIASMAPGDQDAPPSRGGEGGLRAPPRVDERVHRGGAQPVLRGDRRNRRLRGAGDSSGRL